jgi:hypothetical protein
VLTGVLVFDSRTAQFIVLLKQNKLAKYGAVQRLILQLGCDSQQLCVAPVV